MKIGVFLFCTSRSMDPAVLAKRAEELGFESFFVPEHAVMPVKTTSPHPGTADGHIPEEYTRIADPFIALARASAVTRTIKLGTGVCLVPERNPLVLAKEVATLDHFSNGRVLFGAGTGWHKEESELLGGDFPHRGTQMKDAVLAMKELWTQDEAEYHGRYYNFPPVWSWPKPAQKPHPPIFLGGRAARVFKRIVEWGDGWMPNRITPEEIRRGRATLDELAKQAGRDPRSIQVTAFGGADRIRDPKALPELAQAGADRVVLYLGEAAGEAGLKELERLGRLFI